MEYPNDLFAVLFGIIGILSAVTTAFRWKIVQIQNETKRVTNVSSDITENLKEIEELKDKSNTQNTKILELCDRISRVEGAFSQHNKEADK